MRILGDRTVPRPGQLRPLPSPILPTRGPHDLVLTELERAMERERAGHPTEAAQHAEIALCLAEGRDPCPEQVTALRLLCRSASDRRRDEEAGAFGRRAAALALQLGCLDEWAAAMLDWSATERESPGGIERADIILLEVVARGLSWDRPDLAGDGAGALAMAALERDDPEHTVQFAWRALELFEDAPARPLTLARRRRTVLLGLLAAGLARLGLLEAAERVLEVEPGPAPPLLRAARVLVLAQAGRPADVVAAAAAFGPPDTTLAQAAGEGLAEAATAVRTGVWLALALRLARQPEEARNFAAAALTLALRAGDRALVREARAALDAAILGEPVPLAVPLQESVSPSVRRIAAHLERSGGLPRPSPS